jgi:hypothetical protein
MNLTKLDVLNYMKNAVIDTGYISSYYFGDQLEIKDQCCVIGHGLKKLGFSNEELILLGDSQKGEGSTSIDVIMMHDDDNDRPFLITYISGDKDFNQKRLEVANKIRDSFTNLGFTIDELECLQLANDSLPKGALIDELDLIILKTS